MVQPVDSTQKLVIKRNGIYLVNLHPPIGTKPGKLRPCVVIQDDALNDAGHPSTVILPISSKDVSKDNYPLRVFLAMDEAGMKKDSMILVDQFLAWDNRRFIEQIGTLSASKALELKNACLEFFGWN